MLQDKHGAIEYCEQGYGPTIVFVPGSWATRSCLWAASQARDQPGPLDWLPHGSG